MDLTIRKKLIAIVSPAGGVGKSTLSKELGMIFGKTNVNGTPLRVCVVDCNIEFGCQSVLFNISHYKYDIADWIDAYRADRMVLDDFAIENKYTWEYMQKFFVYSSERNVYLLLAPERTNGYDLEISEADMLFTTLLKFFDVVIVDTADALNGATKAAIALSTNTFFVVTDEERCCYKMTAMRAGIIDFGLIDKARATGSIVYNRFQRKKKDQYIERYMVEQRYGFPLEITIPDYRYMYYYNNRNQSAAQHNTPVRRPILYLANKVIPEVEIIHETLLDKLKWKFSGQFR